MPSFRFKLETLLRVRIHEVKALNGALKQLRGESEDLRGKIGEIEEEAARLHKAFVEGSLPAISYGAYVEGLTKKREGVQKELALKLSEVDAQIKELAASLFRRKSVEKLKEKHYCRWVQETEHEEKAFLDEIAAQNHPPPL